MSTKNRQSCQLFYATCHLILFYISTKYHQNISKGIRVTELTRNRLQKQNKGDNSKRKKTRVVTLSCEMLSRPVLHFYQVSSKCSEEYSTYRAQRIIAVKYNKGDNAKSKKGRVVVPVLHF